MSRPAQDATPHGPAAAATEWRARLWRDGHLRGPEARLTPLTGGVSSDIWLVEDGARRFVVKRALSRLRVRDEWLADVGRNAVECRFFERVGTWLPGAVPRILFSRPEAGYFGMEYLGEGFALWKSQLLEGFFSPATAAAAGRLLGSLHARSAGDAGLARDFDTTANFHQLRTEPYLLTTGARHPAWREHFEAEARRLEATREALVHGDFSPKNLLVGANGRVVLLDAEVAWYGDPAFDAAFLLNHLFLKRLYHAPHGEALRQLIGTFREAYHEARGGEPAGFEGRVARLLPLLLLARVDGKSPVEYLVPARAEVVRTFVASVLSAPPASVEALADAWFTHTRQPGAEAAVRGH